MPDPAKCDPPGEPDNLTGIIRAHQSAVWRYLRLLGCDSATAEDLTQEAFVAVLGTSSDIEPRAMRSYLQRVAYRLFLRARSKAERLREDELSEAAIAEVALDMFQGEDEGQTYLSALRTCLTTIDHRESQALDWRYRSRLPRADIAKRLGLSERSAKSLLQRAHSRLRECMRWRMAR